MPGRFCLYPLGFIQILSWGFASCVSDRGFQVVDSHSIFLRLYFSAPHLSVTLFCCTCVGYFTLPFEILWRMEEPGAR